MRVHLDQIIKIREHVVKKAHHLIGLAGLSHLCEAHYVREEDGDVLMGADQET